MDLSSGRLSGKKTKGIGIAKFWKSNLRVIYTLTGESTGRANAIQETRRVIADWEVKPSPAKDAPKTDNETMFFKLNVDT